MVDEQEIWDQILSREPALIRSAYLSLEAVERKSVVEHLIVMTTEDGWHPEQVRSAQLALRAIEDV